MVEKRGSHRDKRNLQAWWGHRRKERDVSVPSSRPPSLTRSSTTSNRSNGNDYDAPWERVVHALREEVIGLVEDDLKKRKRIPIWPSSWQAARLPNSATYKSLSTSSKTTSDDYPPRHPVAHHRRSNMTSYGRRRKKE